MVSSLDYEGNPNMYEMDDSVSSPPVLSLPEPRDELRISPNGLDPHLASEFEEEFSIDTSVLIVPLQLENNAPSRVENLGIQNVDNSRMVSILDINFAHY